MGRLVEGQQKESSLVCKEQNLLQPASPGILPTLTVGHPCPGRSGQPGQEGAAQADLDDYNLPVNTLVMANYNAWHRSAYYWAEPDIFNPDHFLEEGKLINDKEGFPVCISTATPASSAIQTPLRRSTRPARRPNLGRQNYSQNIGCPSYLWFLGEGFVVDYINTGSDPRAGIEVREELRREGRGRERGTQEKESIIEKLVK